MQKPKRLSTDGKFINCCELERLSISGRPISFPDVADGASVIASINGPGDDDYIYAVCKTLEQMQYLHDELQKGDRPAIYELEWYYTVIKNFLIPKENVTVS